MPKRTLPLFSAAFGILILAAQAMADPMVAATVDGQSIDKRAVDRVVIAGAKGRTIDQNALPFMQAQALAQLIDRRLVQKHLEKTSQWTSPREIDAAIDGLRKRLARQKLTLEQHLATKKLTEAELRYDLAWQKSWERLLSNQATDEMLEEYFNQNRRDFDGTQIRVSHILLRPKRAESAEFSALSKLAASLRARIAQKEVQFHEAAQQYSAAPSRDKGGDLGFIERHGPMVEAFTRAAFTLEKGQLSEPVTTPFGVHLITATEIKPGKRTWEVVRDELREAYSRDLFARLADQERAQANIEFTGAMPYFKPASNKLIMPANARRSPIRADLLR